VVLAVNGNMDSGRGNWARKMILEVLSFEVDLLSGVGEVVGVDV
jgi:hypothetical protein